MHRILAALLLALVLVVASPVSIVDAQTLVNGVPNQIVPCNGPDCNLGSFVTLIQNILNFLLYLAVIGAALLFAWAGWLYLSSAQNPEQIGRAKKLFWNVAVGLAIIIGAWLLVDTILGTLLGGSFGVWNQLTS